MFLSFLVFHKKHHHCKKLNLLYIVIMNDFFDIFTKAYILILALLSY